MMDENSEVENSTGKTETGRVGRRRRRKKSTFKCHACKRELPFCWNCPCGFQICDECMKENAWGLTNGPTWVCPDCGRVRMF